MTTLALQAGFPWALSYEEDRRFRLILLQSLLVFMVAGAVASYMNLPQPDPVVAAEPPPRRVRLLAEQPRPAPRVAPVPVPVAPVVTAPPKPKAKPKQPSPAPKLTPRQKAASSGVLAMRDALAELQGATPRTGARNAREQSPVQHTPVPQPSTLTANVTRGSKGIEAGVAHQSVLGASSLPERQDARQGAGSRAGKAAARGRPSAPPPGVVRSEEEIQEILDRNKGAMYTLYNRALREDAGLRGKLVMSITIAPGGNVTRCVILSSGLGSAALEQQLVALVKRIDFGNKPGAAVVTTKIPIEFFPR